MTRRERMERKAAGLAEWAEKADREAAGRFAVAKRLAEQIPPGQPILVGHDPERRARKDQEHIRSNMSKGCEAQRRGTGYRLAALGLRDVLERSVFTDDSDAIEQLRERIEQKKAKADRLKALNAAIRRERKKGEGWLKRIGATSDELVAILRNVKSNGRHKPMFPASVLTSLRSTIRADEGRMKALERRALKTAEAEEAGGGS